jgi:xanthine dehydrogenase accessory factor
MTIWHEIKNKLEQGSSLYLLTVVESKGSAPGRRGFKMIVSNTGYLYGSIGGGIMEFNMVEKAKELLKENIIQQHVVSQVHRGQSDSENENSSGMICSGSQKISFNYLSRNDLKLIKTCVQKTVMIELNEKGIQSKDLPCEELFSMKNTDKWQYTEIIDNKPVNKVHIFGAGHVSVPVSELLSKIGFEVNVYDNREDLNTFLENNDVCHKEIINYENLMESVSINENDYVLLMTHKFTEDKLLLSQLLNFDLVYLGVLGSKNKINIMFGQLLKEGIKREHLQKIKAPIGISINSQTTEEIAVSIVAEMIKIKNN